MEELPLRKPEQGQEMQLFSSLTLSAYYARETHARALHWAKFSEKVHKPSLWINVINFELNVFDASISVLWSPSDPKISRNALIEVFKIIRYV